MLPLKLYPSTFQERISFLMEMEPSYSVLVGLRSLLNQIDYRWCLIAVKKGVHYYLKTNNAGPRRYWKAPGIDSHAGFRTLDAAKRFAARPEHRLYQVDIAHRYIALSWFQKLRFIDQSGQIVNKAFHAHS